jgi:5-formyltetrahydrofolate cyclo-ligase
VLGFASFRTEVDTAPLVAWLLARGVTVALPRMVGPRHIEAFAVTDPAADLAPGGYGIAEPRPELPVVEPAAIDVVIVPGSAFDARGGRLGYGGGFYDAFLTRTRPDTRRVGICFDLQVVARVPREPHDLCVDVVVTERRVIQTGCRHDGA